MHRQNSHCLRSPAVLGLWLGLCPVVALVGLLGPQEWADLMVRLVLVPAVARLA